MEAEVLVFMVTLPLQGHINPMLRFAKILLSKGLHVTLATTEVARQRLERHTISAIAAATEKASEEAHKLHLEFFSDGLALDMDRDKHVDIMLMETLPTIGPKNLSSLIANLTATKGSKFSCIIYSPFVPWAVDVAAEFGIPCAMLFIQPFSVYALYYLHHKEPHSFSKLENPEDVIEILVPGLSSLKVKDLPTFILPSCPLHFRNLIADSIQSLTKAKWVLGNSFFELESEVVKFMGSFGPPLFPVGALVPSLLLGKEETINCGADMWSAEDSCIQWLDSKPTSSVIYVAFGSITVLGDKQKENIAMALQSSNRPFLWVVKPTERGLENKNGVFPSGFLEDTNERGLVVTWSPQEKVLKHPSVACFISHCGWNSLSEAVVAGVPVIAFPGWTDQPTNAKLLVDVFKMGVRMSPGEDGVVSQEEVERCIYEITEGPSSEVIKKRAMELMEAAKKAAAEGGSSDQSIDRFISEITINSIENVQESTKEPEIDGEEGGKKV